VRVTLNYGSKQIGGLTTERGSIEKPYREG
jgi:hypothetical protein